MQLKEMPQDKQMEILQKLMDGASVDAICERYHIGSLELIALFKQADLTLPNPIFAGIPTLEEQHKMMAEELETLKIENEKMSELIRMYEMENKVLLSLVKKVIEK